MRMGWILLWLLSLPACFRSNPGFCDDDRACLSGQRCSPTIHACVPAAPPGDGGDAALADAPMTLLPDPDLARAAGDLGAGDLMGPGACAGPCTCRPDNRSGCSCLMGSTCALSCADDCPETLRCDQVQSCALRCGARCQARCEQTGACDLTTGPGSSATCQNNGTCTLTLGADSTATCQMSTCRVTCLGACRVTCQQCVLASLACRGGGAPTQCPGGVRVCGGPCPP